MEERPTETNHEGDQYTSREEEEEFKEDEEHDDPSLDSNFLSELNLIIVFLSLISMPSENCIDCGDEEMEKMRDHEAHITRMHNKRREIHQVKAPGKQAKQRFQPMIKDCRHGRRV